MDDQNQQPAQAQAQPIEALRSLTVTTGSTTFWGTINAVTINGLPMHDPLQDVVITALGDQAVNIDAINQN